MLVGYPNAWKSDEWVFLENVRNAPSQATDPATFVPVAGDIVEAQAKSSDDEPYSWWKATVKSVRGAYHMISYNSWEDEFNEILEKDMLRPFNKKSARHRTSSAIGEVDWEAACLRGGCSRSAAVLILSVNLPQPPSSSF